MLLIRSRRIHKVPIYASGKGNDALEAVAHGHDIGLMIQPNNSYWSRVHNYPVWCGDNGAFTTRPCGFDLEAYDRMINQPALQRMKHRCLFITAPDVLVVNADGTVRGDAEATLKRFPDRGPTLRRLGFPAALVAQDGLESLLDEVQWDDFDVLFVGGSTEWKLSSGARLCVEEAARRGKRTHMGRVNSLKRMRIAMSWGCDSVDGTFLKFGPDVNLPKLTGWIATLRKEVRKECSHCQNDTH